MALIRADLTELEKIISEPIETLAKIITRPVADRLQKRAAELLEMEKASKEEGSGSVDEVTGEPPASDEPQEWPKKYPPSDPLGASYLSDARIHLDGRAKKRRHLVTINDQEIWLTAKSFDVVLKLALAAQGTPLGWLDFDQLGSIDTYHQVIRRLKKALKASGTDVDRLVENNGAKQYRFSVPSGNITLDEPVIRGHVTGADKLLRTYIF